MQFDATTSEDRSDWYLSPGRIDLERRSGALLEWMEDLARYRAHYDGSAVRPLLLEQAVWALLAYRLTSAVHRGSAPFPLKQALLLVGVLAQKVCESLTGVSIPYAANIAPGLYVGHFGPTVIHPATRMGPGCNISQGVSIGVSGRGGRRGVPSIGSRVYIGANATVAGAIVVGDDVVIGANSLVVRDIPAHCTVVGVPAQIVDHRGTDGMGLHQRPKSDGRSRSRTD